MIPAAPNNEECELLFELEARASGALQLGRILRGTNAGRLVVLRPVEAGQIQACARSVEASRGIAHPRLGKVLGFVDAEGQRYIASEYIEGCTLSELVQAAGASQLSVEPAVAARIVLDALQAVIAGRRLLVERDAAPDGRCFHADAVWVAEFGESFLLEIGIVHHLERAAPNPELEHLDGEDGDVMAAGSALLELLGGSPRELERVTARALAPNRADAYDGPEAMVRALADLPAQLLATEKDVSTTVKRLMDQEFERRRRKLDMLKRDWVANFADLEGESTQFYQTSELLQRNEDTVRPPGNPSTSGVSAPLALKAVVMGEKIEDDETRVYKPPSSELVAKEIQEFLTQDAPPQEIRDLLTRDTGARPLATAPPEASPQPIERRGRPLVWMILLGLVLGFVADRLYLMLTTSAVCREQLWPSLGILGR